MSINYLEKLEYNKIIDIISHFCCTYIGKNFVLNLSPESNKQVVQQLLNETDEAIKLLYKNGTPPLSEIADNTINIKILESYSSLSIKSILDIANIFIISKDLKNYFYTDYITASNFPNLSLYFNNLYTNNSIIDQISKCIIDENTISDTASVKLNSIRKRQKTIVEDIKNKLTNFLHSSSYSKYIQENVVTKRQDRYVIPVKEEYKSQIKGFIHDISSSGSTVFIEPISVFELNNELNNLRIEENLEIEKILQDLTKLFYPYVEELKQDIEYIGKLDFIFGKAKYAKSINAIIPKINDKKEILLNNARHPLLNQDKAVPISVDLGTDYNVLVITGPNTGGKTVTLKTIGLLTCMACSGLAIPADANSSIYVFDTVFADIGDDQSISNSLSTFSSHMKNIVDIVNTSTENSLILVDELGSGTDPIEGASLALSILDFFKNNNSLVVATTHYQELKKYALITDGFKNASVEFDVNALTPTYHLLIGVPGKSNAFEISQKLGLKDSIITNAKSNLDKNDICFEEILKQIYDDKSKIEYQKIEISHKLEEISNLQKSLEKDNTDIINQGKEIINNAKIEARNILLDAKEEATNIISEINNSKNSNSDLNNLRNKLNNKINEMSILSMNDKIASNCIDKEDIKPNTDVFITSLGQYGTVISNVSKSDEVQVQIGNIKTNINIKYLEKVKNLNKKNSSSSSYSSISKSKTISTEINVIGLNVDEAITIIDKFLDDSSLANLKNIRIVHGKGTGRLREGIHKFLKTNFHVKSFRIGTFGEGEMGVIIVELK